MAVGNYRILILTDKGKTKGQFQVKPWVMLVVPFLLVALLGSYLAMWQYVSHRPPPRKIPFRVMHSQAARDGLTDMVPKARDILTLGVELDRVKEFNSKLRIMFNQAEDEPDASPLACDPNMTFDPLVNALMQGRPAPAGRLISHLVDDYTQDLGLVEVDQQLLLLVIRSQKHELKLIPSIWPTKGIVTSGFGWRTHPISGKSDFHSAIDINTSYGAPIYAPAAGTVIFVGWDGAYGRLIKIQHNDRISTRFAHLAAYSVEEGDEVVRHQLIGYVGSSGSATGSHLHYEVRIFGKAVNPYNYILN